MLFRWRFLFTFATISRQMLAQLLSATSRTWPGNRCWNLQIRGPPSHQQFLLSQNQRHRIKRQLCEAIDAKAKILQSFLFAFFAIFNTSTMLQIYRWSTNEYHIYICIYIVSLIEIKECILLTLRKMICGCKSSLLFKAASQGVEIVLLSAGSGWKIPWKRLWACYIKN